MSPEEDEAAALAAYAREVQFRALAMSRLWVLDDTEGALLLLKLDDVDPRTVAGSLAGLVAKLIHGMAAEGGGQSPLELFDGIAAHLMRAR